jgi:branched-chain amino acid transport system permease protein
MSGAMIGFFVADGLNRAGMWASSPVASLVIVMLASMTTSTVIAVSLERFAYRPLRNAPRLIPLITSIGASFFLQYAFRGLFGEDVKTFPQVTFLNGAIAVGGFRIIIKQLVVVVVATVAMTALYLFVEKTKLGKSIRAVSEDQEIARLMGIDVDRTISLVFAIGGAMAGLAGSLYLLVFGNVFFFSGFILGIKAFASAVLGGIGNILGAALGGVTLGAVESIGPSLVLAGLGVISANQLKDMIGFLALVLVLIFRPTGILGERLAEDRT